jgi:lysophospholipase L1-like esterase
MSASTGATKVIQVIFVGSLLAPLLTGYFLNPSPAGYWPYLNLSLVGLALAGWLAIRYLARRGKNVDWFLSIAALNLLLLAPELILRQLDFRYETGIQFGYPRLTHFESFILDDELFWRLRPERPGVNSWGFPGPEIALPKPANTYRLLFLGDSVAQQGYPAIVETLLNQPGNQAPRRIESVSLALSGYSTYQGRVLVNKYGDSLGPDLVLVCYGWNDHWLAYGDIDSKKKIRLDQSAVGQLSRELYHRSRLLQGLRYLLIPWLGADQPLAVVRVPADEYRENLLYIGSFFSERNVPIIFITPPTSHHRLGVPDYLVDEGFALDKASVLALHQHYNQIAREVTTARAWPLLDLEREWAARPDLAEIFIQDGIHLTPAGSTLAAERIASFIRANWETITGSR